MTIRKGRKSVVTGAPSVLRSAASRSWWLAIMAVVFALPLTGQDAGSQIRAEAERLQHSLKDKPIAPPGDPNASAVARDGLSEVIQRESAGKIYFSLEKLGQLTDYLYGLWATTDKVEAVKSGLPAYEAEWEKVSTGVTAIDKQASGKDWSDSPVALRAMSETAQGMTMPLLEGARGFAVANGPTDGLFNLGQAQGQAQFAAFCATLHLSRQTKPYPLRSLMPEIEIVQEEATAAFQPPKSIDLHTLFMQLNTALKQARELDATKNYAGALYQYLYAVGFYGMLDAAPVDPAQQSALKNALAGARQELEASERDDSIEQVFVELAESKVVHVDGSAPSADDWKVVKAIVDEVLPAYFALDKPLSAVNSAPGKTIEVTLVRWPYT